MRRRRRGDDEILPVRQASIELAGLWSDHPESFVFTSQVKEELLSHSGADRAVQRSLVVNSCSWPVSQSNYKSVILLPHQSDCIRPDGFAGGFEHHLQTPGGS